MSVSARTRILAVLALGLLTLVPLAVQYLRDRKGV